MAQRLVPSVNDHDLQTSTAGIDLVETVRCQGAYTQAVTPVIDERNTETRTSTCNYTSDHIYIYNIYIYV